MTPGLVSSVDIALDRRRVPAHDSLKQGEETMTNILWVILVIVVAVWLIGLLGGVGGSLIHVLLVVGVLILAYNLITGRRSI